jgi:DNA-3-methyladenine glycosylase II
VQTQFTIQAGAPFDFGLSASLFARFPSEIVDVYRDGVYHRVLNIGGRLLRISLCPSPGSGTALQVSVWGAAPSATVIAGVERAARHILGLDFRLDGFYKMANEDSVLAPLIERYQGLGMACRPDVFEALVMCITTQQINLPFAYSLKARLVRRFGRVLPIDGADWYAFPTPEALAGATVAVLREMQYSQRKAEYIIGLAAKVASGDLDLQALANLEDDAFIDKIVQIRGLGRWSAEWALVRGLGRPDVIAADDIGVQRAFSHYCLGSQKATSDLVRAFAETWRPYRSYAVHYLLMALYQQLEPWYAPGP